MTRTRQYGPGNGHNWSRIDEVRDRVCIGTVNGSKFKRAMSAGAIDAQQRTPTRPKPLMAKRIMGQSRITSSTAATTLSTVKPKC